jgi:Bacterial regulatory helix-turn-helix protein, lysR family
MASSPTEMSVFERVADRGSFSGAAEDMGLSASAAAKLISWLELRLGVGLINRTTRRLHLPPKDRSYLERARNIGSYRCSRKRAFHLPPHFGRELIPTGQGASDNPKSCHTNIAQGMRDSNSEMSGQNIPLKGRTDFR